MLPQTNDLYLVSHKYIRYTAASSQFVLRLQQHLGQFELFLFDLLYNHGSELTEANLMLSQQLMDILERCGFHPLYPEDMDGTSLDRVKIVSAVGLFRICSPS